MNTSLGRKFIAVLVVAFLASIQLNAATINIQTEKPGHKIAPTLWGVFFEDINLSADGGIYPELVRNLSFEDAEKPDNWKFANVGDGKTKSWLIQRAP